MCMHIAFYFCFIPKYDALKWVRTEENTVSFASIGAKQKAKAGIWLKQ
jgi:hypothetical protein